MQNYLYDDDHLHFPHDNNNKRSRSRCCKSFKWFCMFPTTNTHPPINKVFVFVLFALYAQRLLRWKALQSCEKAKYFLTANQQNSTSRKVSMSGSQTQLFNYFVSTNPNFATCCNVCFTVSVMAHKRHYDAICIEAERC